MLASRHGVPSGIEDAADCPTPMQYCLVCSEFMKWHLMHLQPRCCSPLSAGHGHVPWLRLTAAHKAAIVVAKLCWLCPRLPLPGRGRGQDLGSPSPPCVPNSGAGQRQPRCAPFSLPGVDILPRDTMTVPARHGDPAHSHGDLLVHFNMYQRQRHAQQMLQDRSEESQGLHAVLGA
jgi:hypothetical protein